MRPQYESAEDRAAEHALAERVARATGTVPHKLKLAYRLDYVLCRDGDTIDMFLQTGIAFMEVKVRKRYSREQLTRLGGYMLGLDKWMEGKVIMDTTGLPFAIAIQLTDCALLATFKKKLPKAKVKLGGRTDRNDWQDREPVVFIPMKHFDRNIP